jgi:hypothetical protein
VGDERPSEMERRTGGTIVPRRGLELEFGNRVDGSHHRRPHHRLIRRRVDDGDEHVGTARHAFLALLPGRGVDRAILVAVCIYREVNGAFRLVPVVDGQTRADVFENPDVNLQWAGGNTGGREWPSTG